MIPARIERGPTDLLRALASTVGTDFTAPHYRYHDDPWTIPYYNNQKKDFSLSKDSGRAAARYILEKHPTFFQHNRIVAEPPITAFQPRSQYNRDNVTIELLDNMCSNHQVGDALAVYQLLVEKKKTIPRDSLLSLLELAAYNCEEESLTEESMNSLGMLPRTRTWHTGGVAEQIYSQIGGREARLAMLVGLARHGQKKRARQLWDECRAAADQLPVEAYNAYLASLDHQDLAKLKEEVVKVLTDMREHGVRPDSDSLVSCLHAVANLTGKQQQADQYGPACLFCLALLAEFRGGGGVEPSLGAYKLLIDIFAPKGKKSGIVQDILREIQSKNMWPARSREDFYFFSRAMQVANMTNNIRLAYEIHDLLYTEENINLVGDFQTSDLYYMHYLTVVMKREAMDTFMQVYSRITPHTWAPGRDFYGRLLEEIKNRGAVQYLGKVFDDIELGNYGGANKESQYEMNQLVLRIMEANEPAKSEFKNLSDTWVNITQRIVRHLILNKTSKAMYIRFNTAAAGILSSAINILLREGQYEAACAPFDLAVEEKQRMPGQLTDQALAAFLDGSIEAEDVDRCVSVVEYAADMNCGPLALSMALRLAGLPQLSRRHRDLLNKILVNEPQWAPL